MIYNFVPDNICDAQWYNTGDGVHTLGIKNDEEKITQENIFAAVKRLSDGTFYWRIKGTDYEGKELSKELAIEKIKNLFFSAMELREILK
ncbi:MAG: hypothetical protein GY928_25825 [Colwellia sp.]|nr:hypothetical protein [Colwellia sp.]